MTTLENKELVTIPVPRSDAVGIKRLGELGVITSLNAARPDLLTAAFPNGYQLDADSNPPKIDGPDGITVLVHYEDEYIEVRQAKT